MSIKRIVVFLQDTLSASPIKWTHFYNVNHLDLKYISPNMDLHS